MKNVLIIQGGDPRSHAAAAELMERLLRSGLFGAVHVTESNIMDYVDSHPGIQFSKFVVLSNAVPESVRWIDRHDWKRSRWVNYHPPKHSDPNDRYLASAYFLFNDRLCLTHPNMDSGRGRIMRLVGHYPETRTYRLEYYGMTLNEAVIQMSKDLLTIRDFRL